MPNSQKGFAPILILLIIVVITLVAGGVYYFCQQSKIVIPASISNTTPKTSPADETTDWKTYKLKNIDLEFKLPPKLSESNYQEITLDGETGKMLCFQIIKGVSFIIREVYAGGSACDSSQIFGFGGSSQDFSAGRSGWFTDLQGFEQKGNKYFAKSVSGKSFEIPSDLVKPFSQNNDVQIIKVIGKNDTDPNGSHWPKDGTPGDGYIGALVNTKNDIFPGISVFLKLNQGVSEEEFDQILSTFKFTK